MPLIESLWLRTGPFMRVVYGRIGTSWVIDHHEAAIRAIETRDAEALARAIRDDIREGMGLMAKGLLPSGLKEPAAADDREAAGIDFRRIVITKSGSISFNRGALRPV